MYYSFFSSGSSSDFFNRERQIIINQISSLNQNELLNIGIEQYSEYLTSQHSYEYPVLDTTTFSISSHEADIPAARFPIEFAVLDGTGSIKRDIIVFHVPYSGDISCMNYEPSTFSLSGTTDVQVANKEFLFEYINFYNDSERIKREFYSDLDRFNRNYQRLKSEFDDYNKGLKDFVIREINNRKQSLLAKNNFLASFDVPLKSNESVPKTFSIPAPKLRDKITVSKPTSPSSTFIPEPTLDYNNYLKILKLVDDVGKNFERMPSIYKSKEEEDLRDHILMVLDPNFEYGSATGETFNKKGKTDILLRYDSSVVFVAECKFWAGENVFHKTIDQLLGYLTWRDSKTAVIIFVRNKEIIPVLQKIGEEIPLHPCHVISRNSRADNWFEHTFHLPLDRNKEIALSTLVFHLPDT